MHLHPAGSALALACRRRLFFCRPAITAARRRWATYSIAQAIRVASCDLGNVRWRKAEPLQSIAPRLPRPGLFHHIAAAGRASGQRAATRLEVILSKQRIITMNAIVLPLWRVSQPRARRLNLNRALPPKRPARSVPGGSFLPVISDRHTGHQAAGHRRCQRRPGGHLHVARSQPGQWHPACRCAVVPNTIRLQEPASAPSSPRRCAQQLPSCTSNIRRAGDTAQVDITVPETTPVGTGPSVVLKITAARTR